MEGILDNKKNIYTAKKISIIIGGMNIDEIMQRQNYLNEKTTKLTINNGAIGLIGAKSGKSVNDEDNILIFVGEPVNRLDISKISDYRDAIRILPQYDGAYIAIYYDTYKKKLIIVNDFLGFQPLYYYHSDSKIVFSSDTKAFGCERDIAGWGSFFSWGHLIGNRTLVKNVKKVSHASITIVDLSSLKTETQQYWKFPDVSTTNFKISNITESFKTSVQAYIKKTEHGHLLLSGGFDSRFILCNLKALGVSPDVLIVSHDDEYGNLDGRIAEKYALAQKLPIKKSKAEDNFFSSRSFLEYLALSDAQTSSLFLFISKIAHIIREASPDAIWDGLVPDKLLKNPHYNGSTLKEYISQNTFSKDSANWRIISQLFKRKIVDEMRESYLNDLNIERKNYYDDEFGVVLFNLLNRGARRIAINPLQVYANFTRPFIPGMSKDFFNSTISVPFNKKRDNSLYLKIFKEVYPEGNVLPFLSGNELFFSSNSTNVLLSKLRISYYKFTTKHPTIFQKLGLLHPTNLSSLSNLSDFLKSNQLFDDPFLNFDYVKKISPNDTRYKLSLTILFHWKAWELLHTGRLSELGN